MTATMDPSDLEGVLRSRYEDVRARVGAGARASGRSPDDVVLVAVTKYAEPDQIRSLIRLGHRDFGENRVQQLVQRASMVEESLSRRRVMPHAGGAPGGAGAIRAGEPWGHVAPDAISAGRGGSTGAGAGGGGGGGAPGRSPDPVRWHMVGHLQRNKVRKAVEFCRLIHSVDSLRLAEEIQLVAVKREQPVDVLVQVNCSGERSKFGCPKPAAAHLAEQIDTMVYVRVRGLMTMAPLIPDPAEGARAARETFSRCRELFDEIATSGVGEGCFNILSMGMSSDFEIAIAEGANMVRVGSAIFGEPKAQMLQEEHEEEG